MLSRSTQQTHQMMRRGLQSAARNARFTRTATTSNNTTIHRNGQTRSFSSNAMKCSSASEQQQQQQHNGLSSTFSFSQGKKIRLGRYTFIVAVASLSFVVIYQMMDDNGTINSEVFAEEITKSSASAIFSNDVLSLDHNDANRKPRLVILGSGWGAISLLHSIDHTKYEVIIVSPRNYFLFTPMLPSTTTGAVDYRSIVDPIRCAIYRKTGNKNLEKDSIQYFEAKCESVDHKNNRIVCEKANSKGSLTIEYDKLVVSVGATVNTFGTKGVEEHCHFLKEVDHARKIRQALITSLEKASYPGISDEERRRLLHFAIVGGGPAGTELAAELNDFLVEDVNKFYPHLLPYVQISILEMTDHILSMFDKSLSDYTEKKFKRDRINLVVNNRVMEVREKELVVFDVQAKQQHLIPYGVCVWSTGIKQNPLIETIASTLPDSQNHRRALVTDGYLAVQGIPQRNIYAIGDCSRIEQKKLLDILVDLFNEGDLDKDGKLNLHELEGIIQKKSKIYPQLSLYADKVAHYYEKFDANKDGTLDVNEFKSLLEMADNQLKPLPATAQVASQQGSYLGQSLNKEATNSANDIELFKYAHWGSFAFVGGSRAVADIPVYKSGGLLSYVAYKSAYFQRQVSWKNRFALVHDWMKSAGFGRDISKL